MLEFLGSLWSIIIVVLAFSVLIFVHELGHFLAALLVGVKPERFFIGFDIYGLSIKKEYKGCVYGIGLLPLGGYCKLAGQSDDPREQKYGEGKDYEYTSKPLWARAIIISAGVIMNMIFGFLLLMYGYMHGVPSSPAVAGIVIENSPAANADIQSGDKILEINGEKVTDFAKVKETFVMNPDTEFTVKIKRNGKELIRRVKGIKGVDGLNQIGLMPAYNTTVADFSDQLPFRKNYYQQRLQPNDQIIAINGKKITTPQIDGYEILELVNRSPGKIINTKIKRDNKEITIAIPVLGSGYYDFGYRIGIDINSIVPESPAEKAGLQTGDRIIRVRIKGKDIPLLSNLSFIQAVNSISKLPVQVKYERDGKTATVTIKPVFMSWNEAITPEEDSLLGVAVNGNIVTQILSDNSPLIKGDKIIAINKKKINTATELRKQVAAACTDTLTIDTLRKQDIIITPELSLDTGLSQVGIGMEALPKIHKIIKNSEASKFLTPGCIVSEVIISPDFSETAVTWINRESQAQAPYIFKTPQNIQQNKENISGSLPMALNMSKFTKSADSIGSAAILASKKSVDMSLTIYKLLQKLITQDISTKAISGPIGIIRIMKNTAEGDDAFMRIISLLALLSINLAVVNLLPFPVLDGGHLVFILYEAIRGNPPGDRFRELAQYFGVICLFSLMIYVTYNDVIKWFSDSRVEAMLDNSEAVKNEQKNTDN